MSPRFSVVICTLNRRASLLRCLKSLAELSQRDAARGTDRSARWDVWVVDNNSTDGTLEAARELAEDFPLRLNVVREERAGLSCARNRALEESAAEVVVYTDDDVSYHDGWFDAWEAAFVEGDVVGAGGPVLPVFHEELPDWFRRGLLDGDGGPVAKYSCGEEVREYAPRNSSGQRCDVGHPRGCNMAMRRQLAIDLGGFREDLGWGRTRVPAEETEFYQRLHDHGGRVLYLPAAKINHHMDPGRLTVPYIRRWYRGYGRASIMMRPPGNPWAWSVKFAEQGLNLVGFSLRLALPGGQQSFRAHKKQGQAMGRLAQLLGL